MPIVNVPALAVGTNNTWTLAAGATKMAAIATSDGDTTTVDSTINNGDRQGFTADYAAVISGGAAAVGVINTIQVFARCRSNNGNSAAFFHYLRLSASFTDSANNPLTSTSYLDFTSASLARPGGGSFVQADLTGLEFGLNYQGGGAGLTKWTYGYMILDYVPLSGSLISLLVGFLGPLIAINLHDIPRIVQAIYVKSQGNVRISINEYSTLYQELKDWKHPKHFCFEAI